LFAIKENRGLTGFYERNQGAASKTLGAIKEMADEQ